ncbi:hypothetical protein A8L45_19675 [Veronia pacifica]|uniref:Uncharacterized protein n=1 Tax=Veronia pacifica TaxID=1080227 RepID=A0A1C3EBN3_9GAMM|nr:hypothetical protein A8L45_19675 [Veronia pacifica]
MDLCIYKNGKFEKKYNSSEIELDRNKISVQETLAARYRAYKSESDPIYLEWQYDKTPESEQVWRDKVAEIKARYPLPDTTPIN